MKTDSMFSDFTLGCDPELFLQSKSTGKYVSSHGLFPGTKQEPFKVRKGAVQVDGTALEFNVDPARTADEFLSNVTTVVSVLQRMVRLKNPDLQLCVKPTVIYDQDYFSKIPDEAKKLGCEPDFSAYTGEENYPPETNETFRTGAGHLHVGFTEFKSTNDSAHIFDCMTVVKQLDASLYIPSLLWDDDRKRRELYGKVGSFRPKSYGVEWRPLSNAWVSDPDISKFLFDTVEHSLKLLDKSEKLCENGYIAMRIQEIQEDTPPDKHSALNYHKTLVGEWGFPELPREYTL